MGEEYFTDESSRRVYRKARINGLSKSEAMEVAKEHSSGWASNFTDPSNRALYYNARMQGRSSKAAADMVWDSLTGSDAYFTDSRAKKVYWDARVVGRSHAKAHEIAEEYSHSDESYSRSLSVSEPVRYKRNFEAERNFSFDEIKRRRGIEETFQIGFGRVEPKAEQAFERIRQNLGSSRKKEQEIKQHSEWMSLLESHKKANGKVHTTIVSFYENAKKLHEQGYGFERFDENGKYIMTKILY